MVIVNRNISFGKTKSALEPFLYICNRYSSLYKKFDEFIHHNANSILMLPTEQLTFTSNCTPKTIQNIDKDKVILRTCKSVLNCIAFTLTVHKTATALRSIYLCECKHRETATTTTHQTRCERLTFYLRHSFLLWRYLWWWWLCINNFVCTMFRWVRCVSLAPKSYSPKHSSPSRFRRFRFGVANYIELVLQFVVY